MISVKSREHDDILEPLSLTYRRRARGTITVPDTQINICLSANATFVACLVGAPSQPLEVRVGPIPEGRAIVDNPAILVGLVDNGVLYIARAGPATRDGQIALS